MSEDYSGDNDRVHSPALRRRWDVFLNFRGADTRHAFTIPLLQELEKNGVRAFFDDEGLRQGDSLDPVLYDAIRDSGAAIVIMSPKYASSRWCLEELAAIVECRRLILPVFYGVDPSDVRKQRGPFEGDFKKYEERLGAEIVGSWRNAMKFVGNLKGRVFNTSSEPLDLIHCLVNDVLSELKNTPIFVAPYVVGLDSHINKLMTILNPTSRHTIILGLHGLGGVGKTTLAKALFNKLVPHFQHRSFISNVREASSKPHGLASLEHKLVKDLSGSREPVLIVLDDVDQEDQLRVLLRERKWLHEGSRVVITTRNIQVLVPGLVSKKYEVKELGDSDSLELFSYHAFRMKKPMEEFSSISARIIYLTGRLPLALEVFGSLLYDQRSLEKWEDTLNMLKKNGLSQIQNVLRISYDGLDEQQKQVFLDIACLLLEMETTRIEDAIDLLDGSYGFGAKSAIDILIQRSLLKIQMPNELWMHDQIREMGRQIVRGGHRFEASRLWEHREILRILQDRAGTERIEGIILNSTKLSLPSNKIMTIETIASNNIRSGRLNLASIATYLKERYEGFLKRLFNSSEPGHETVIRTESFQTMRNLRFLHLNGVKLEGDFRNLPPNLKCLLWNKCPLKSLPSAACPREVTVLDLSESNIETLWAWWDQGPENLIIMNLYGCHNLRSIPNLTRNTGLRKLNLERCKSLRTIHRSIRDLTMLRTLNLEGCSSLVKFPEDVSGLKLLESLNLSGCSLIKELSEGIHSLSSLRHLVLDHTAIMKLPESLVRLTKLEKLSLISCKSLTLLPVGIGNLGSLRELFLDNSSLKKLPDSIGSLKNLHALSLRRCTSLSVIPDSIRKLISLKSFWLNGSSVVKVPASIGSLHYLQTLSVANCSRITALPASIDGLAFVTTLDLDGTSIQDLPDQIEGLKSLQTLLMINCTCFKSLPQTVGKLLSLNTLIIVNTAIEELPESIGDLENLSMLKLNKNGQLHRLPESIGKLESLHNLRIEETAIFDLPGSFGKLSNLRKLKMRKTPSNNEPQTVAKLPPSFCDLSLLQELDAKAWGLSGTIPDEFQNLSSLDNLNLGHNNFHALPSSLEGLTFLTEISVEHCKLLQDLPPLPSALVKLNASDCTSLTSIADLSKLKNLKELNLTNCERLQHIKGLECLKSLRWLYMFGCNACASDVKGKLNKSFLKKLHHLSMPGRGVPDWFTHDVISCSIQRNYVIKAVIIVVVICVNHEIEEFRHLLPVIPGVRARILRLDEEVYGTTLFLKGVPKTYQDQVYLCRHAEYHPLVSILRDGDKIQVALQSIPCAPGIVLKECGIHLVFENEDEFDGDEELLEEKYKTPSEKLTRHIKSPEDRDLNMQGET